MKRVDSPYVREQRMNAAKAYLEHRRARVAFRANLHRRTAQDGIDAAMVA